MKEYLGLYDEQWIQLHTVKIKAKTKGEAEEKFLKYIESQTDRVIPTTFYVIPLFALETI